MDGALKGIADPVEGLRWPQDQVPSRGQALPDAIQYLFLGVVVEIDEHVAAEDDVPGCRGEAGIVRDRRLGEVHETPNGLVERVPSVGLPTEVPSAVSGVEQAE